MAKEEGEVVVGVKSDGPRGRGPGSTGVDLAESDLTHPRYGLKNMEAALMRSRPPRKAHASVAAAAPTTLAEKAAG